MHREHNCMCVAAPDANWTCVYNRPWPLTFYRGRRLIGYGLEMHRWIGRCWLNSNINCTHVFVEIHKHVFFCCRSTQKKLLCEPLKLCLDEFGSWTHTATRRTAEMFACAWGKYLKSQDASAGWAVCVSWVVRGTLGVERRCRLTQPPPNNCRICCSSQRPHGSVQIVARRGECNF